MRHNITVVGSLNIDLVTVTPRIPAAGETLRATSFDTGFGGKGANQAVACARLRPAESKPDFGVYMIGAVGGDAYGADFVVHLKNEGINSSFVKTLDQSEKTGTSLIIVDETTGDNRILFSEGANAKVLDDVVRFAKGIVGGIIIFQLETPLDAVSRPVGWCTELALTQVTHRC